MGGTSCGEGLARLISSRPRASFHGARGLAKSRGGPSQSLRCCRLFSSTSLSTAPLLAVVPELLSQFGQKDENVQALKVAARAGSQIRGCGLGEPAALTLFGLVDGRAIVRDPRQESCTDFATVNRIMDPSTRLYGF